MLRLKTKKEKRENNDSRLTIGQLNNFTDEDEYCGRLCRGCKTPKIWASELTNHRERGSEADKSPDKHLVLLSPSKTDSFCAEESLMRVTISIPTGHSSTARSEGKHRSQNHLITQCARNVGCAGEGGQRGGRGKSRGSRAHLVQVSFPEELVPDG